MELNNENLYCTVHFTYDKGEPMLAEVYERIFMAERDMVVDLLNPHYEEWNAEYDKEIVGEDDSEYLAHIRAKQNKIIDEFNSKHTWLSSIVKLHSDEIADIVGILPDGNVMHLSMKLINEKEWKEYHGIGES